MNFCCSFRLFKKLKMKKSPRKEGNESCRKGKRLKILHSNTAKISVFQAFLSSKTKKNSTQGLLDLRGFWDDKKSV